MLLQADAAQTVAVHCVAKLTLWIWYVGLKKNRDLKCMFVSIRVFNLASLMDRLEVSELRTLLTVTCSVLEKAVTLTKVSLLSKSASELWVLGISIRT